MAVQVGADWAAGQARRRSRDHAAEPSPARALGSLSDEALLALVSRDDEGALAELYDRYGQVAFRLAFRVVRDAALAEDAVQEAFLAIWRAAGSFLSERATPRTWILTLVHRRAVDVVRREQRLRIAPFETVAQSEAHEPAAEEHYELSNRRRIVQHALKQLPDNEREALELAYYGGLTQSELAVRLGVPIGTIKGRMFRGLRRLRDLLADASLVATDLPSDR
jgi:RNA polymerase sigma factor (sigma-70 family)